MDDSFHDKIRQATSEAQSSKREAVAENVRRRKAEKNALDAIKRVSFLTNVNWLAAMLVFLEMVDRYSSWSYRLYWTIMFACVSLKEISKL